jgi:hypothetical protein
MLNFDQLKPCLMIMNKIIKYFQQAWENFNKEEPQEIVVLIAGEKNIGLDEALYISLWRKHRLSFILAELQRKLSSVDLVEGEEITLVSNFVYWLEFAGIINNKILDRATAMYLIEHTNYQIGGTSCDLFLDAASRAYVEEHPEVYKFGKNWCDKGYQTIEFGEVQRIVRKKWRKSDSI